MRARSGAGSRVAAAAAALTLGCGGLPTVEPKPPDVASETGMHTCPVAKDPLHPFIVEWPAVAKTELDAKSQQGPVVVSLVGCVLKVLPDCQATGAGEYKILRTTPQTQSVAMEDESQLRAHLPLGAVSLSGELSGGRRLTLDYVTVGQKVLSQPPTALGGRCEGATHYVSSMVVGAFSLASEATLDASAEAEIASRGGAVKTSGKKQVGGASGDVEQCKEKGAELPSCQGLLQLGLSPLELTGGKVAAAGFGAGLGALPVVPKMGQMQELQAGGALANVDAELLQTLQEAKRADRTPSVSSPLKAAAWDALARYKGTTGNPYGELAVQRRDDWIRVANAEQQRREQVSKACGHYVEDRAKLDKLLSLDEDIASRPQKAAYQRELETVYAPWASEFQDACPPALARPTNEMRAAAEEKAARLAGGVHIDFARPDDGASWNLRARDGLLLCELPCSRWVGPQSGAYVSRDEAAGGQRAYPLPSSLGAAPGSSLDGQMKKARGSVGGAAATSAVSGAVLLAGLALTFVPNGETCYDRQTHAASGNGSCGSSSLAVHDRGPWIGPTVLAAGGVALAGSLVWLGWSRRDGLDLRSPAFPRQGSQEPPPVEVGLGRVRGSF